MTASQKSRVSRGYPTAKDRKILMRWMVKTVGMSEPEIRKFFWDGLCHKAPKFLPPAKRWAEYQLQIKQRRLYC